ncbi:MFS transporter [Micromonospora cathayae]|uniref:MFS transporter n=1 Tax=Micromonospora cathayae TaxID=3028804 RepID=A0ABY7ZQK8_9ACTN|nr:MFS transporter [Micromonospora sp. HUAS 3]WDZ85066.1 MFS transporter [Micromonospora sp. HUAS 3]
MTLEHAEGPAVSVGAPVSRNNRWAVLAVMCTSLLLAGIDLTVLNVAVPNLTRDLLPSGTALLWIVDIYSLTVAALLVTSGTIGDRIGRKRLLLAGFAVFGLASLGAALSTTTTQLIVTRALLGAGTAMIIAATVSIIRVVFVDDRERTLALGLWTAAHSVGATVGPVIGGLLLQRWWWGSVFLVNVPIIVVVLVAGFLVVPESKSSTPRRWDLTSALLSIVGLGGLVYAIKEAGSALGLEPTLLVSGLGGLALLVWFTARQRRLTQPLLDITLFANRRFSLAVVCVLACFGSYVGLLYLLTQWFQLMDGYSPLTAGFALVPLAAANAVGAIGAPWLSERWGRGRAMALALGAFAVAMLGLTVVSGTGHYPQTVVAMLVAGAGAGVVMTLGADAIMASAEPERAGEAAAVQETSFELGAGLGVAILGTVLLAVYGATIRPPDLAADDERTVRESIGAATEVASTHEPALAQQIVAAAQRAFENGFSVATGVAAATLALTAVLTATMLRHSGGDGAESAPEDSGAS